MDYAIEGINAFAHINYLQRMIVRWSKETFKVADADDKVFSCLKHLEYEIEEARANHKEIKEYADIFILLLDAIGVLGFSMDDLYQECLKKMKLNFARQWGEPDGDGVIQHIEKESQ